MRTLLIALSALLASGSAHVTPRRIASRNSPPIGMLPNGEAPGSSPNGMAFAI